MLKKLWIVPVSAIQIRNFSSFLLTYAGFNQKLDKIIFRNGVTINTGDNVDCSTISVIFFSKDYGDIPDKTIIIDIGANIGVFSLYCGQSDCVVYAFEPVPANYALLKKNILMNHFESKIIPSNVGVCGVDEKRDLFLAQTSQFHSMFAEAGKGNKITIDCLSLKTIFEKNHLEKCDILKIDCEGAEYEIFYQAPASIIKKIHEIRMEYHNLDENKNNIEELTSYFVKLGFAPVKLRVDTPTSGIAWFKQTI